MKRNKTFNYLYTFLIFLPLIALGVLMLINVFNMGNTDFIDSETSSNYFYDSLFNICKYMGYQGGKTYSGWWSSITIQNSLNIGLGFPFVKYFIGFYSNLGQTTIVSMPILMFANIYFNYIILVSLVAFLPKVFMTFINFAYNLCDKFTERSGRKW